MPETVRAVISVWIDNYRALYASEHDYLFIARNGGPVRPGTMYAAMRKLTREKLGVAVSPHRFRDAAATYFVQEMPELATRARVVLKPAIESLTRNYRTKIGRASCRERVCQYVSHSVDAVKLKKKKN